MGRAARKRFQYKKTYPRFPSVWSRKISSIPMRVAAITERYLNIVKLEASGNIVNTQGVVLHVLSFLDILVVYVKLSENIKSFLEDADTSNNLRNLLAAIQGKSFALVICVLMLPASLPIPTAGITHVLELVTLFVALQMVVLRKYLWLPENILNTEAKWASNAQFIQSLTKFLQKVESFSSVRGAHIIRLDGMKVISGLCIILFTLAAFFAFPGTGLDTLPALGVVLLSLSLILEDLALFVVAIVVGIIGMVLVGVSYLYGLQGLGMVWTSFINLLGF